MRQRIAYITLWLCLIVGTLASAQTVGDAMLEVKRGDADRMTVHFTIGNTGFDTVPGGWLRPSFDGMYNSAPAEGAPALPQLCHTFLLPRGSKARLAAPPAITSTTAPLQPQTNADSSPLNILPFHPTVKSQGHEATPEPDKDLYDADLWLPGDAPISIEHVGTMGRNEVYRIAVHPLTYNPNHGQLRIAQSIDAMVVIELAEEDDSPLDTHYLIVAPQSFAEVLQPFMEWKRQEGYEIALLHPDTPDADSIRQQIHSAWDTNPPQYILLVGDTSMLRPFVGTARPAGLPTHPTDLYFAEHTGDYLPDAIVGRWPVSDTSQLRTVVEKTIAYSRGLTVDTSLLRRVLLVAGREQSSPAPTTTNGQVNYLSREIKSTHPEVDTICYHNPQSMYERVDILQDISHGAAILNYTAHCTALGWSHPAVDYAAIDSADAPHPMLWVNNCCLSNDFTTDCLGRQLLLRPVGGAIGTIGATNSTLWDEDYFWAVGPKIPFSTEPQYDPTRPGAFDHWTGRMADISTQGELLQAGNLSVTAHGSTYDRFYWEIYCLLGDPSLRPFYGTVTQAAIAINDEPYCGSNVINLTATPRATLTVLSAGRLIGRTVADSTGSANILLREALDTTRITITATGANLVPFDTVLSPLRPAHGMAITNVSITDTSVHIALSCVGYDTVQSAIVSLLPDSTCSHCTTINAATLNVGPILPGQSVNVNLPYSTTNVGQSPRWTATFLASDSVSQCAVQLSHRMNITYPTLHIDLLNADSTTATTVEHGGLYIVHATADGDIDSLSVNTTELTDSLDRLLITAEADWQGWHGQGEWYAICGQATDGFEHGLSCYPWQDGGTTGWIVDSTQAHSGHYSIRNGHITHRQTSELRLDVLLPHADSISYWYKASSEPQADRMRFSIDGIVMADHWGSGNWHRDAFAVAPGHHTFSWRYSKDASVNQGNDCVWIDDLRLPLALWDAPYGCPTPPPDTTTTGIAAVINPALHLYPNPASTSATIDADGQPITSVELLDMLGRTITTVQAVPAAISVTLDTRRLTPGLYIIICRLADGRTMHHRLAIRHQ